MSVFPDLLENISQLSKEELFEVKNAAQRRWVELRREEFMKNAEEVNRLAKEGKLYSSNNIEEIMKWLATDEDTL